MYSAIKLNGKKLYQYAREGKKVELEPRKIEIYNIELKEFNKKDNEIVFAVECSKGTYIRTLCENIAEKLNSVGCMKELERTRVGIFCKEQAITIDELKNNKDNIEFIDKHFISFEKLLDDKEYINLNNQQLSAFLNGVKMKQELPNGIYKIKNESNMFIGTGTVNENILKRDVIL